MLAGKKAVLGLSHASRAPRAPNSLLAQQTWGSLFGAENQRCQPSKGAR